jgi:hypothetical protein
MGGSQSGLGCGELLPEIARGIGGGAVLLVYAGLVGSLSLFAFLFLFFFRLYGRTTAFLFFTLAVFPCLRFRLLQGFAERFQCTGFSFVLGKFRDATVSLFQCRQAQCHFICWDVSL